MVANWERVTKGSAKSSFPMCHKHNAIVESFTSCGLCRRRLTIGSICTLGVTREELAPLVEALNRDSIPSHLASESTFVCKLCKAFCGVKVSIALHQFIMSISSTHPFSLIKKDILMTCVLYYICHP